MKSELYWIDLLWCDNQLIVH